MKDNFETAMQILTFVVGMCGGILIDEKTLSLAFFVAENLDQVNVSVTCIYGQCANRMLDLLSCLQPVLSGFIFLFTA